MSNLAFDLFIALFVFLGTVVCGYFGLPILRKLRSGQTVREDGPKSHYVKSGTTTFGGLFFLLPLTLASVLLAIYNFAKFQYFFFAFLLMLAYAAIGFLDDYIKTNVDKGGLKVKQKIVLLGLVTILFSIWYLYLAPVEPSFYLPFWSKPIYITALFKPIYLIFSVLFIFYIANSANLNDGVDGLCSSLGVTGSLITYLCLLLLFGQNNLNVNSLNSFSLALGAGCLGFFLFNKHPAKVFMGDTGSQGIGAGFAAIMLLAGVPWLALFTCLLYILDGLSVLLQVWYFRHTGGKRIFRMAPVHHHFELGGWKEQKIVWNFNLLAILGGIVGIIICLLTV